MAKAKVQYICQSCGAVYPRWLGQCSDCGEWNTILEGVSPAPRKGGGYAASAGQAGVELLSEVSLSDVPRITSGSPEMDRVLGGGVVPGGVMLIGGDPGIGKSTLLLQVLAAVQAQGSTLYVTGEESLTQVRLRAERLGLPRMDLPVLAETRVEAILQQMEARRPGLVVLDSVQTLYTDALDSAPGSVSQLRECAAQVVRFAKRSQTAVVLVGHVTKEGAIAGPRVLEHMVDTVLYFEHDAGSRYRIVRAVKNRFGAVNELAVFAMTDAGLKEVSNPSALFLSRHAQPVPGSVISVSRQGSRPLLAEVQALVDRSALGTPRRVTLGLDSARLNLLLAVLHRHGGVSLADQDVFANVVGGMKIQEPAADLALLLAVLSSFKARPCPTGWIAFGEVGLAGEIRAVQAGEERLIEAAKQGFTHALIPQGNVPRKRAQLGIEVLPVARLEQALDWL